MEIITFIGIFVVVWWIVFFAVLPLGLTIKKKHPPGHASSAPERPRVGIKALIATIAAALITYFFMIAVERGYGEMILYGFGGM